MADWIHIGGRGMKNSNKPAYPSQEEKANEHFGGRRKIHNPGLTKREAFVKEAMGALLSNPGFFPDYIRSDPDLGFPPLLQDILDSLTAVAIAQADAQLKALEES